MNARAMVMAQDRQLDWLLGEVLGGALATRSPAAGMSRWLAAALALLAIGAAVGTALLRDDAPSSATQEPARETEWTECHGAEALAAVDKDVTALKCFDFDDAACAQLARFTKLEYLDLSGADVNDKGYSVPPRTTDAGVRSLAALTRLRWLCLARCHDLKGEGLQALEALPRLEHLDLTYSGVESTAIERLPRLPSLRSLVLSHCLNFHGRSLAAVATIPGLRRLDLSGCPTLAAADVLHLVKLTELRHLDLRDCQGRFRGQRDIGPAGNDRQEEQPQPVEDGIGITDAIVAALAAMPLETLLLGGSESLTDAIGEPLSKMTTLRALDLSDLPKVTGALLARIPDGLESLALDQDHQLDASSFAHLPPLATLKVLGLSGVNKVDGTTLKALLANKQLTTLRLGGVRARGKGDPPDRTPRLRKEDAALLAAQAGLKSLDVSYASWVNRDVLAVLAQLPQLAELDLSGVHHLMAQDLERLAESASLRALSFRSCQSLDRSALSALARVHLRELDLHGTNLLPAHIRDAAKVWPGCRIRMPDARLYRVP